MSPPNESRPEEGRLPKSRRPSQTGGAYPDQPTLGEQGELDIPAHRLVSAEHDLRLVMNTIRREPLHWWLRSILEHQSACSWCRRCDWPETKPGAAA